MPLQLPTSAEMPSPHAGNNAAVNGNSTTSSGPPSTAASSYTLPASAYNFHLNSSSNSNLSASYAASSRSITPVPNSVIARKPLYDSSVPVSRTVYGSYPHTNSPSHIANSAPHISSALNYQPTKNSFSAAALPRTSSLLPPPRITVGDNPSWKQQQQQQLHDPFQLPAWPPDPINDREREESVSPKNTRRRGSKSHSRSSSLGGLSDGFRNLNRWSISTASSRASNAATPAKNRFSRRMSIDSTTLFSQSNNSPASPRRLHKARPSTAGGSGADERSFATIPPLEALPPILPLPSLEQEDFGRAVLSSPERNASLPTTDASFSSMSLRAGYDVAPAIASSSRDAIMPHNENGSPTFVRGHQRSRSQGMKSSTDSAVSPGRSRGGRPPSQKAMLSKALEKANTAVRLDNAQSFEEARSAYHEACDLLQQVLERTPGDDDRKKLEDIRTTYSSRIEELDQMLPKDVEIKALPQTPASPGTALTGRSRQNSVASTADDYSTTSRQRSDTGRSQQTVPNYARPTSAAWRPQMSADSPKYDGPRYVTPTPGDHVRSQSSISQRSPRRPPDQDMFLARPMQDEYMPPPLSPRRPPSPPRSSSRLGSDAGLRPESAADRQRLAPDVSSSRGHQRTTSLESTSWLDPIDESDGSSASSVHSRTSSLGIRRKHIRSASGDTEAEFDAALDDAIEAAYDDGYEPAGPEEVAPSEDDVIAQALRKVQLAKERVRQSELEMQRLATDRDQRMRALKEEEEQVLPGGFYDAMDSDEEEERILEEMTDGYDIGDFTFGAGDRSKGRVPRESDSSELTSRTWQSSTMSNPPTSNTMLTTVSETPMPLLKGQAPLAPPPTASLPKLPPPRITSSPGDSVRDRRLSGTTNVKQLKIETQKLGPKVIEPATAGPTMQHPEFPANGQPKTAGFIAQQRQALSTSAPGRSASLRRGPSPVPPGLAVEGPPPTPPVPAGFQDERAPSPAMAKQPTLRKNFSSNSLKNMKTRNLSITNIDEYSDVSPSTPLSNPFAGAQAQRLPALPTMPTPVASAFRDRMTSAAGTGGYNLFDADIHSPMSPSEPVPGSETVPVPLEPCPKEVMLRPFWLMRALYQTLCHPKGGYISNKLFVPRDAWRVKGVKIKNMEDKISQCDLLTAALQKLDMVDSDDADAVLEEMQSLENVLEQVQTFLQRRLGNEVGVQGSGTLFKDADGGMDGQDGKPIPRNNSISGKSAFSWKRLRNKTSSTTISNSYERGSMLRKESSGPEAIMATVPFTDNPSAKSVKRDLAAAQFSGPHAHYMAALAKLFDAAQSIDQIARQVEDPGLRHQDKTQVGLELSTRHAAEFFAFYICRFVLQDLTMMLDKFIKRGSEWVLV